MTSTPHAAALRGAGLRVTAPRLATLDVVAEHPHIDAEALTHAVRDRLGTVSRQAVYDVLRALTESGLVRRVCADGRAARFELESQDNHHHLLCRQCGQLEDVPCATGSPPCLHPPGPAGARVELADVVYHGLCPTCAAQAAGLGSAASSPAVTS